MTMQGKERKIITPVQYNHSMRRVILICVFFAAGCVPNKTIASPTPKGIQIYETVTPGPSAAQPTGLMESAQGVLPSSTPSTYIVRSGDTLGQIAEKFNIDLDALQTANPAVNPNGMRVGETLMIPAPQNTAAGESTPTPVPFSVEQIACHATANGGLWCFVLAHNDLPDLMEDVTVQVTLIDRTGQPISSQTALLPLNILQPSQSLPLSVFFAPQVPAGVSPQVQILTAIRLAPNDQRYLPATVQNTQVQVDVSGLNAQVSGQVTLPAGSKPAGKTWVAAVAYDGTGNVAGVRRWESNAGPAAGRSLPFAFMVSSVAGKIERVEFAVEARP